MTTEVRKWEDVNTDCLVKIFEKVGIEALVLGVSLVCKSWYKASLDPQCWKVLDFQFGRDVNGDRRSIDFIQRLIKCAVYRSCGMATKVVFQSKSFQGHCFDDIIEYVLERCSALQSLTLPHTRSTFNSRRLANCLVKQIKKWKDLEFIALTTTLWCFEDVLTEISTHCKKFVALEAVPYIRRYEEASPIVALLPNIKRLILRKSYVYRESLVLILSRCRELELLDVSDCRGFDADDEEILEMASNIPTFKSKGSKVRKGSHQGWEEVYAYYAP